MKAPSLLIVVTAASLFLGACSTLPPWSPVPTGESSTYGKIQNQNGLISFIAFSDSPDILAISLQYTFGENAPGYTVLVDRRDRRAIQEALSKYFEWEGLAAQNNVDITKEIATVTLLVMERSADGWTPTGRRDLKLVFSSRTAADGSPRASLLIQSSSFWGSDQLTLTDDQVRSFQALMQDNAVAQGYGQAEKKQHAVGLFN